jgi:hypothetical protein
MRAERRSGRWQKVQKVYPLGCLLWETGNVNHKEHENRPAADAKAGQYSA